jgi:hypothetical protein
MRTSLSDSTLRRFVRLASLAGAGALVLAGCAIDPNGAVEDGPGDPAATTSEALFSTGGGTGGNGFTCDGATCTCSKTIEGDCDRMRINCTGDMTSFDNCLKGWLTTDCSCTEVRSISTPRFPQYKAPTGGVLLSP